MSGSAQIAITAPATEKRCRKCGLFKSTDDFYPNSPRCKRCHIQDSRAWALNHPKPKPSKEAPADLDELVAVAYTPGEDGVRRWFDINIGEWLGFVRPRDIRRLIETKRSEIERHGTLRQVHAKSTGGRPALNYWLTFEQSMVICSFSQTERAASVREVMIRVFTRVMAGLATMERMEQRALEASAQSAVASMMSIDAYVDPILNEQRANFNMLFARLDALELYVTKIRNLKRRNIQPKARAIHITLVDSRLNGICPCCHRTRITRDGQKLESANFDHFLGAHHNKLAETWLVCAGCNKRLEDDHDFKLARTSDFHAYQAIVRAREDDQNDQDSLFV